jgi:hypothetical protein
MSEWTRATTTLAAYVLMDIALCWAALEIFSGHREAYDWVKLLLALWSIQFLFSIKRARYHVVTQFALQRRATIKSIGHAFEQIGFPGYSGYVSIGGEGVEAWLNQIAANDDALPNVRAFAAGLVGRLDAYRNRAPIVYLMFLSAVKQAAIRRGR